MTRAGLPALGYAYVGLAVISFALLSGGPARGTDAEIVGYYSESGHRWHVALGFGAYVLAAFAFLWFVGGVRARLVRYDAEGLFASLVVASGAAYAALQAAGVAAFTAVATSVGTAETVAHSSVDPPLVRAGRDLYWLCTSVAAAAAATTVLAASIAALRARRVPRWFGRLGLVGGAALLAAGVQEGITDRGIKLMFPLSGILFMVWVLVAATYLLRSRSPA